MSVAEQWFDDEKAILKALVDLRRQGVAFADLERRIAELGPVDLDLLKSAMDRIRKRIAENEAATRRKSAA